MDAFVNVMTGLFESFSLPLIIVFAVIADLIYRILPRKYCIWEVDEEFVYDSFLTYPSALLSLKVYSFLTGRKLELIKKEK